MVVWFEVGSMVFQYAAHVKGTLPMVIYRPKCTQEFTFSRYCPLINVLSTSIIDTGLVGEQ